MPVTKPGPQCINAPTGPSCEANELIDVFGVGAFACANKTAHWKAGWEAIDMCDCCNSYQPGGDPEFNCKGYGNRWQEPKPPPPPPPGIAPPPPAPDPSCPDGPPPMATQGAGSQR